MIAEKIASNIYSEMRREAVRWLREARIESAEADARILLGFVTGMDAAKLLLRDGETARHDESVLYFDLIERRISGEPVARIVGEKEFWSLRFALNGATLVPRPETETLVEAALLEFPDSNAPLRVLDLGTGTGALLAAILSERPFATGVAVDKSEGALRAARGNFETLGLLGRAQFVCGEWTAAIASQFDLMVANPPYIASAELALLSPEVRDHDPWLALDGGADGLEAYRSIVNRLPECLTAHGVAVLELGQGQEPEVSDIVQRTSGLELRAPARLDLSGIPRALVIHAKR